ncbi:hypothetical protein EMIHUDRAFT_240303 [Emiliania huxleyi CCMP1516]|uniref:C2 domain-containing protein n=2 Tax=Emiliania huxleyi TaxID=2903 RepID=A0A0D3JG08_EMIH1|nr:hypothetical protein EMIHUDRAFT_240303 [Emiliania huxleyi CCMP1516]EOD22443.1 hypothetical protein EMIHUDRAFT_240303 [Emiliania huxleyi CCMP1516]|eukprot:XP_005774872.1 hypothetical protein EMIHUDRAFT_240303 [Emiliania huxleyi CCMP1516]
MAEPPFHPSISEEVAMTATRLRARYGAVPTEEARDDDDESPTASLLGGTAVASDASRVSEELSSRSFGLGGGLATGPTSPVPVSAEKAKRLAHLRQKYRQQDSAPDLSHAAGQSPPSSLSVDVRSVRIDLRPRGSGRAVERRESFLRQGSGGKSAASSSDAYELTPRWSAYSLPAGVHPSSLVLVKDFWNAKLGQLTIHAGQAWADEAERGPQFTAFRADGEERHSVQFYAYPADGGASPPQGTVAVYEYFNTKLRRVTAHPGGPWPDETRGAHDDEELVPDWLSGRMECPGELEALIEERPFERWEVLASEGASAVCGSLKGLLRVVRREEDAPIAELPVPLAELLTPALHVVRLYVLRAEHLMPADASGTSDPYLRITLGDTTISTRERKISRVTDAEFYERFELRATLPGEAELRIEATHREPSPPPGLSHSQPPDRRAIGDGQVMDHDLLDSDDLIGYTKVDLEDRVFSREWRELGERTPECVWGRGAVRDRRVAFPGDLKPLEWRPLHSPYSNNPQGRLQLWVDVFPLDVEAPPPPPCDIAPPGEQRWELRVIVWRTRDVLPHDYFTEMNDLYAVVAYGTAPAMHTDTHWRCRDGCGSFNWRCKFPLRLGHRRRVDERLTVQLWDRDVLKYNDNIGEVVVPLQRFFAKAFRARLEGDPGLRPPSETSVRTALARLLSESAAPLECVSGEAQKLWLPLHAKSGAAGRPKSAGWVEVSVELVPAEVAEAFPAGAGLDAV